MGAALVPILARHGVAAYLCGHEHNLQHLTVPGQVTHYVVSGGGSQVSPAGSEAGLRPEVQLFHAGSGGRRSLALSRVSPRAAHACTRSRPVCVMHPVQLVHVGVGPAEALTAGHSMPCTCQTAQ